MRLGYRCAPPDSTCVWHIERFQYICAQGADQRCAMLFTRGGVGKTSLQLLAFEQINTNSLAAYLLAATTWVSVTHRCFGSWSMYLHPW